MPAIASLFETLKDEADGVAKATIETAFPLEADGPRGPHHRARAPLQAQGRGVGRGEPELIGGARITVGDNVIDGTVQERLRAMAAQLRA
jgi:F-type H+-transporting ATPase subunit delta